MVSRPGRRTWPVTEVFWRQLPHFRDGPPQ